MAGHESVCVVNINHVLPSGSWIAGLCEFSSTFVFLSDRDVSSQLPVPAIGDKVHQPSCFRFPQCNFGKKSVVKQSFQQQWQQLTELEIDGCK